MRRKTDFSKPVKCWHVDSPEWRRQGALPEMCGPKADVDSWDVESWRSCLPDVEITEGYFIAEPHKRKKKVAKK